MRVFWTAMIVEPPRAPSILTLKMLVRLIWWSVSYVAALSLIESPERTFMKAEMSSAELPAECVLASASASAPTSANTAKRPIASAVPCPSGAMNWSPGRTFWSAISRAQFR